MNEGFHLAQFNIARMRATLEDPSMEGFVSRLETVNALAEETEGFVWRLQSDEGDATSIRLYDDELILINMSVWESPEALHAFTYSGAHLEVLRQRQKWFETMEGPTLVLWWVPAGYVPTAEEGKEKLEVLRVQGASADAFSIKVRFPPPVHETA